MKKIKDLAQLCLFTYVLVISVLGLGRLAWDTTTYLYKRFSPKK